MSLSSPTALASHGAVVAEILERLPGALAIYAFGSKVSGNANADSDLDLAVLVGGYVDPLVLWDLASDLAEIAGCAVDLLDLRAATTVMQYQVITTGQCLWSVGLAAGLFECYVLSEKTNLDTARAALLGDVASRGSVYG